MIAFVEQDQKKNETINQNNIYVHLFDYNP